MRQLVHQNQLRPAGQRCIQIKFLQGDALVFHLPAWQLLESVEQRERVRTDMALHIADHHIHTVPLGLMRRLQHGIGLSHPGSVPEKDFQLTAALLLLLLVQGVQQILRIRPLFSGGHFPHLKSHHANSSEFSQQQYYSRKQLSVV